MEIIEKGTAMVDEEVMNKLQSFTKYQPNKERANTIIYLYTARILADSYDQLLQSEGERERKLKNYMQSALEACPFYKDFQIEDISSV